MSRWRWICLAEALAVVAIWWWTASAATEGPAGWSAAGALGSSEEVATIDSSAAVAASVSESPRDRVAVAAESPPSSGLRPWTDDPALVDLLCEILDDAGTPILGAHGVFAAGSAAFAPLPVADRAHRALLTGLAGGEVRIRLEAEGHLPADITVTVAATPRHQRCTLRMTRTREVLLRVVTQEGEDFDAWLERNCRLRHGQLQAVLTPEPVAGDLLVAETTPRATASGSFRPAAWSARAPAPKGVIGYLYLHSPPPVSVTAWYGCLRLGDARIHDGDEETVIRVDSAALRARMPSLRLRVVDDANGAPVAGARIDVGFPWGGGGGATSDGDGIVLLDRLVPGELDLNLRADGYAETYRQLDLRPGTNLDLGDIALTRPGWLRGRVFRADGTPAAGLTFAIHPTGGWSDPERPQRASSSTDAEGRIALRLGAERYQAVFGDERHGLQAFVWERGRAEDEEAIIRLVPGAAVTLAVSAPAGRPRLLWLLDEQGRLLHEPRVIQERADWPLLLCAGWMLLRVEDLDRNLLTTLDLRVPAGGGELRVELP